MSCVVALARLVASLARALTEVIKQRMLARVSLLAAFRIA
jgi:hypothetical protein